MRVGRYRVAATPDGDGAALLLSLFTISSTSRADARTIETRICGSSSVANWLDDVIE
jgi:hypothetical protein